MLRNVYSYGKALELFSCFSLAELFWLPVLQWSPKWSNKRGENLITEGLFRRSWQEESKGRGEVGGECCLSWARISLALHEKTFFLSNIVNGHPEAVQRVALSSLKSTGYNCQRCRPEQIKYVLTAQQHLFMSDKADEDDDEKEGGKFMQFIFFCTGMSSSSL